MCCCAALGALTVGTWFVPCLELKSDSLVVDYLDTDCLPWSSFALWMALLLAGFTYVSFWTCGRDNPFQGPSRTYYVRTTHHSSPLRYAAPYQSAID